MRWLACLVALSLAQGAAAQTELDLFGAMVEGPDGAALATATSVGGTPEHLLYLTSAEAAGMPGACLRIWARGACHPARAADGAPLAGLTGLGLVAVTIPNDEMMAKFSELQITAMPTVGTFDAASDGRQVRILTQNAFGGWEIPLDPAEVSGKTGRGITIRTPALSGLSAGAPVVHSEKGLIGVIDAAQSGSASVVDFARVVEAVTAAGHAVPPELRPQAGPQGELPRQVDNEMGRLFVFSDNSSIQQGLSGFYGPSQGLGFDANFVTGIEYSVWSVDLQGASGALLASGAKTVPMIPSGMPLEAPYDGTPPDIVATCVLHATPASQGRRAMVMQFWRAVPDRYNPNTGNKSYDEAAPPLTGWADHASPCADRLTRLDAERRAALQGLAPTSATATPPVAEATTGTANAAPPGEWAPIAQWPVTGYPATSITLAQGRTLTLGCTESRELVLTVAPGAGVAGFLIGGRAATEQGEADGMAYGFFPGTGFGQLAAGASIGFRIDGAPMDLPGPTTLQGGPLGDTCGP